MVLHAETISRDFMRRRGDSNVFTALSETTIALCPGTVTAVMGHSGSGKSTLLHICAGLLRPTRGRVLLDETDLYALDDKELSALRNRHFGLIPQGQSALGALTVLENVLLPCVIGGNGESSWRAAGREIPSGGRQAAESGVGALSGPRAAGDDTGVKGDQIAEAEAEALLQRFGIAELRDVLPSELSGGEIRRMAIARALIQRPEVIFADEPTGDLDAANTKIVLETLRERAQEGAAVLLITHERDVVAYADVLYTMENGVLAPAAM